uniref:Transposase n=1 Tax=Ditylenchus dipsaci TaxID=166011 RepID=A0A915EQ20_9BILA
MKDRFREVCLAGISRILSNWRSWKVVEVDEAVISRRKYNVVQVYSPWHCNYDRRLAGYNGVADLPEGYEHYVVNHSENFVNPDDSDIYTQSIESMHQIFKHRHKKEYGTARSQIVSYIEEYLW